MKSISQLQNQLGIGKNVMIPSFHGWLLLNKIRSEGGIVIIKLDGQRAVKIYTVTISGGSLGEEYFRKDGDDLELLIVEAVNFYDNIVWSRRRDS